MLVHVEYAGEFECAVGRKLMSLQDDLLTFVLETPVVYHEDMIDRGERKKSFMQHAKRLFNPPKKIRAPWMINDHIRHHLMCPPFTKHTSKAIVRDEFNSLTSDLAIAYNIQVRNHAFLCGIIKKMDGIYSLRDVYAKIRCMSQYDSAKVYLERNEIDLIFGEL